MPYLSQAERDYITEGVHSDLRADGRGRLDYRALVLETGIISQANGSARVRLGGGTDVLVGVKVEIDQVEPDAADIGKVVCNVEWYVLLYQVITDLESFLMTFYCLSARRALRNNLKAMEPMILTMN
jgi:exosome complex RNA-binding protein Rrp42 (RNase PH superfamily)